MDTSKQETNFETHLESLIPHTPSIRWRAWEADASPSPKSARGLAHSKTLRVAGSQKNSHQSRIAGDCGGPPPLFYSHRNTRLTRFRASEPCELGHPSRGGHGKSSKIISQPNRFASPFNAPTTTQSLCAHYLASVATISY